MTRFFKIGLMIIGAWLATNACGGRTVGLQEDDGSGFGNAGAFGSFDGSIGSGATGSGARFGSGAAGSGARSGSGGRFGAGGSIGRPGGAGGFLQGGAGGFVRPPPAGGGFVGAGGFVIGGMTGFGGQCSRPNCDCPDCFSACYCETGNSQLCDDACFGCQYPNCGGCGDCYSECECVTGDPGYCEEACFGGGGGNAGSCGFCPSIAPSNGPSLPGCCLNGRECGVEASVLSVFGLGPGCIRVEEVFQPGRPDMTCVDSSPAGLPGCCRPDGTCGVDLGQVGFGCLPGTRLGQIPCGGTDGGSAGGGGFPNAGGAPSAGGSAGSGNCCAPHGTPGCQNGSVAGCVCGADPFCCEVSWDAECVDNVTAFGCGSCGNSGGAGGAGPIQQCVTQARNDCEACACSGCFEDLLPCFGDVGCPAILQCANRTGCTGPNCYQPNTCQAVIDQYGGIGSRSTQLAIPLFSCLQNSGCPCGFGG